jgi:hypothetical protein
MVPVTDPKELEAINAWADTQKVDGLFPGWVTWKFVDDSGKFCGFYQQGVRVCGHFHVDTAMSGILALRAERKVVDFMEASGTSALLLVPPERGMCKILEKHHQKIDAVPFVRREGGV